MFISIQQPRGAVAKCGIGVLQNESQLPDNVIQQGRNFMSGMRRVGAAGIMASFNQVSKQVSE